MKIILCYGDSNTWGYSPHDRCRFGPNLRWTGVLQNKLGDQFSEFTGAKHSIAVTSCTTALHLSLVALGFKEGDEAIVPAFTWISTANVVEHLGGKVIFCDIDFA